MPPLIPLVNPCSSLSFPLSCAGNERELRKSAAGGRVVGGLRPNRLAVQAVREQIRYRLEVESSSVHGTGTLRLLDAARRHLQTFEAAGPGGSGGGYTGPPLAQEPEPEPEVDPGPAEGVPLAREQWLEAEMERLRRGQDHSAEIASLRRTIAELERLARPGGADEADITASLVEARQQLATLEYQRQGQQQIGLADPLRRRQARPNLAVAFALPTFAASEYNRRYSEAPKASSVQYPQLFGSVQQLAVAHCQHHNLAAAADIGQEFTVKLMAQTQQAAQGHAQQDGERVTEAAQLLWTSNRRLGDVAGPRKDDTLFAMLNDTIRKDRSDQSMVAASQIARCITEICVRPKNPPGVRVGSELRRVYRGGGIDAKHKAFYDEMLRRRTLFRVPQFLATTLTERVALRFMRENSAPKEPNRESVLWHVNMDADTAMWNAALVDRSHYHGEEEYLFVPYSTFALVRAEWREGTHAEPHLIELLARPDNSKEKEDLPTAPWA